MAEHRNENLQERAPLLLVFGDLAGKVAALVRARPLLIGRLIVAPREAVHAIGAYLHLAADPARPDVEVAAVLGESDPRDLLRAALPGCPPRLYRALDRAGDRVRGRDFYKRLGAVARDPLGDVLLDGGPLDDRRLAYFEAIAAMDPVIASLRGDALPDSGYTAEAVDSLVAYLRGRGALRDDDFHLPPKSGLAAVARRLQRGLDRIPAPDPGFVPPPPYRLVTTTADLQRIGKVFGNCVARPQWHAAQHHFHLLDGTGVYLVGDTPPLLVALRRVGAGLWVLDQMAGPKNVAPPKGAQETLLRDLAAADLKVVATEPHSALARLDSEIRRRREAENDDADDDEDGLDDDLGEVAA